MQRVKILLGLSLLMWIIGGYLYLQTPQASPELQNACRQELQSSGRTTADMLERCSQPAFAALITARDASSAAAQVSAANRSEMGGSVLAKLCLGLALGLFIGGLAGLIAARRKG